MTKNLAIVGVQWGDEGKGKIVDILSAGFDYVVRYQREMYERAKQRLTASKKYPKLLAGVNRFLNWLQARRDRIKKNMEKAAGAKPVQAAPAPIKK